MMKASKDQKIAACGSAYIEFVQALPQAAIF
jgi:hypothetical protein